jgi:hypothetical protein
MRTVRNLLILIVVLCGLALGADRVGERLAEADAADRIKAEYDLSREPSIDIKGFPFLTQVLGKEFEHVDIDIHGIEAAGAGGRTLRITDTKASLHQVRVVGSAWDRATAKEAEGRVRISYDDLSAALPLVKVGYGGADSAGKGQIKATVGADFLGRRYEESLLSTVTIEGGDTLRLRATGLENSGAIPGLDEYLRRQIDYEWRISELPDGLELKKVEVTKTGITVTGGGVDVELSDPAADTSTG